MRYRRAVLVADPSKDASLGLLALRRVAPALQHLLILLPAPSSTFAWFSEQRSLEQSEEELRTAAAGAAATVDVQVTLGLDGEALTELCIVEEIDLLVFCARSLRSASLVASLRKRTQVAILWAGGSVLATGPIRELGCVAPDERTRLALGAFLRDHAEPSMRAVLLSPTALAPDVLSAGLEVSGVRAPVEVSIPKESSSMLRWLREWTQDRPVDLWVFARVPGALFWGMLSTAPILLVPPLAAPRAFGEGQLDVPELVDDGGPLRVRAELVAVVGSLSALPDHEELAFVSGGRVVAAVLTSDGEAELPAGLEAGFLGVYRVSAPEDPTAAIEEQIAVLRPQERPLLLFDAELSGDAIRALAQRFPGADLLAVRLRPTRSCRSIRGKLRGLGVSPWVIDARAVLDEGLALDVSEALDPVRLARVASRLKSAKFPVEAIAHQGELSPWVHGFDVLSGPALESTPQLLTPPASEAIEGNRIELELDNLTARRWLIEAIASSQKTVHLQVYMAQDDEVGGLVEGALSAAGARGVTVRVLVDSLHGLHGSFGTQNPLLARLSGYRGVELRTVRPLNELPSVVDLKQRDHRKLVVVDGQVALLGGRNLSHEYYISFDEVRLTAASGWREVPWLDAGARVEGPAVAALEASFLEAWTGAGGDSFPVITPAPAGGSSARVVVHHGLRDVRTLETYLELIQGAKSHLYLVSGFPLLLELQHALLRAIARGVRVRSLTGHVTPTHNGQPFNGAWSTARTFATRLLHSRLDPLIEAGAEAYLFAQEERPGWEAGLGVVHPHVHAKVMSVDGLRCTVGSANLDITGSYWESELLLLVEDSTLTRLFETQIDTLMAGASQVRREDPAWQQLARGRSWMRRWPGVLSV